MTNAEAISLLRGLEKSLDGYCELNDDGKKAFNMAVSALELFGNSEQLPSAQPEIRTQMSSANCISRQAAIDLWEKYHHTIAVDAMQYDAELRQLPSAQPEQRWIPCDKGEPDEDMECWVTVKTTDALYRGNFTKRFGKGFVTSCGFMWWNTALAWMPIYEPEPYRTEGDDNHEG